MVVLCGVVVHVWCGGLCKVWWFSYLLILQNGICKELQSYRVHLHYFIILFGSFFYYIFYYFHFYIYFYFH